MENRSVNVTQLHIGQRVSIDGFLLQPPIDVDRDLDGTIIDRVTDTIGVQMVLKLNPSGQEVTTRRLKFTTELVVIE